MKTTRLLVIFALLSMNYLSAFSQASAPENFVEVYGFAMADMGYNFNQVDPAWYDVMRPSKLPSYKNQFGMDGNFYLSARQSRFGIKSSTQTEYGELKTVFDFDMFGMGGDDAGKTTIRLRHAYGQLGHWGAGQTESAFMDLDVFPNTFEYWGPCGMLFFRNVQLRWIPILGPSDLVFALEMPGASADKGVYADRVELSNVTPRFPLPDFSGHYRQAKDWGYLQLGWMVRDIQWDDMNKNDTMDLTGSVIGWGLSLSSNVKFGKNDVLRLQGIYGAGVENYFNDAPIDVGATAIDVNNKKTPVTGEALANLGITAFLDHSWSSKYTSSIGYSTTQITNSKGQEPTAFKQGQMIEANFACMPVPNVMAGVELQWIDRKNYTDGFHPSATKINFSFKYSFSQRLK
jgi:hypothetical protein